MVGCLGQGNESLVGEEGEIDGEYCSFRLPQEVPPENKKSFSI